MKRKTRPSGTSGNFEKYVERRKFRGEFDLPVSDSDEGAVIDLLQSRSDDFGVPPPQNLELTQNVSTPTRKVIRFRQLQDKIPILYSYVVAQVDKMGKAKQLDLAVAAQTNIVHPNGDEKIAPKDAIKYASLSIGDYTPREKTTESETVYYPTRSGLRLAYRVLIPTREPAHDWQIVIDAYTGEVLEKRDLIFEVDGQGLLFDPNPVVTANDNTFRDPDATVAACGFSGTARATIDSQRVSKTLKDLSFSGGTHKLEGPFVKMRNFGLPDIAPPEEANANDFNYSSGDPRFEAVMVYYHIDTVQRYIQSLAITTAHNSQIEADAHEGSGAAFFSPVDGGLHFSNSGPCRPDRAEDGEVMVHEYGHAIHHDQVPGWGDPSPITMKNETRAMGEGFGDVFACIFFAEHGGGFQREVFEDWIFGDQGGLRRVDGAKVYPTDWVNQVHADGEIWSASLWNVYRTIGGDSASLAERQAARNALLKTLILSHHRLVTDSTMSDGAEAVMEENAELEDYRGKHLMQMLDSFHDRGLLVCSSQADLYIREASDDPGSDNYVGPVFWNSPDLWIRNIDDGGTTHQNPEYGQDNWFYARVSNRGTATARAFVVTFNFKPWAGTQFVYSADFVPYVSATVGFNLPPGASTIVKAKWPSSMVPAGGTHTCLLASVYTPTDVSPIGKHVWEHNNLAQKNLTIVDLVPNDSILIPFKLGSVEATELEVYRVEVRRPQEWATLPVSIVHKDPLVVKRLFNSIEMEGGKITLPTPVVKPKSVFRFLDPTRIEILAGGTKAKPIRINLGKDSTLDVGTIDDESSNQLGPSVEFSAGGREANLVLEKSSPTAAASTSIAFNPGVLAGFPIVLRPRSQLEVGLKITAPAGAKQGDVFEIHLIQRNKRGAVVGGITVQVNIK